MDMKKILQAMDGASSAPVEGSADMQKFVSIIAEGANPHKVALPVQMAMQHYQAPAKKKVVAKEQKSQLHKYLQLVESEKDQARALRQEEINKQARIIAERVLRKNMPEGTEARPPSEGPVVQAAEAGTAAAMGKLAQEFAKANKLNIPAPVIESIIKRSLLKYSFPVVNTAFSIVDVLDRSFNDQDYAGAAMAMVSGISSLNPGGGQTVAVTLDIINQIRDYRDKRGLFATDKKPATPAPVAPKDMSQSAKFATTQGGAATGNPKITNQVKNKPIDEGDE